MAPFGKIVADPSELKHVGELMGCIDRPSVIITIGLVIRILLLDYIPLFIQMLLVVIVYMF